jgi:16S rRNA (guanine966-N2)-methyltransferase
MRSFPELRPRPQTGVAVCLRVGASVADGGRQLAPSGMSSRRLMHRRRNQVRIIAGRWRGRKLPFPDLPSLRPTPDRVRETLFNWLAPRLPGARCLDLFAGSGALGFEAASRGAERVVLVERDPRVVEALRDNRRRLEAGMIDIIQQAGLDYLRGSVQAFEVVFLDAPYGDAGALQTSLHRLTEAGWLNSGARIYVETALEALPLGMPQGWDLLKEKRAGQVSFRLYAYQLGAALPRKGL